MIIARLFALFAALSVAGSASAIGPCPCCKKNSSESQKVCRCEGNEGPCYCEQKSAGPVGFLTPLTAPTPVAAVPVCPVTAACGSAVAAACPVTKSGCEAIKHEAAPCCPWVRARTVNADECVESAVEIYKAAVAATFRPVAMPARPLMPPMPPVFVRPVPAPVLPLPSAGAVSAPATYTGPQVVLESKIARLPADVVRELGVNEFGVRFLDNDQLPTAVGEIGAAVKAGRGKMLSAPTLTTIDDQAAVVHIGRVQPILRDMDVSLHGGRLRVSAVQRPADTGVRLSVRPKVSADGRFVRLDIGAAFAGTRSGGRVTIERPGRPPQQFTFGTPYRGELHKSVVLPLGNSVILSERDPKGADGITILVITPRLVVEPRVTGGAPSEPISVPVRR